MKLSTATLHVVVLLLLSLNEARAGNLRGVRAFSSGSVGQSSHDHSRHSSAEEEEDLPVGINIKHAPKKHTSSKSDPSRSSYRSETSTLSMSASASSLSSGDEAVVQFFGDSSHKTNELSEEYFAEEQDEQPLLFSKDDEDNLVGVQDGVGGDFFIWKLFGKRLNHDP